MNQTLTQNDEEQSEKLIFFPEQSEIGKRIDVYLNEEMEEISRSSLQKIIEGSNVFVRDEPVTKSYKIRNNDEISVFMPKPVKLSIEPQNIPLDIVYEDSDVLVVNKAKGMVVHPAAGHSDNTLVNAIMYHCGDSLSGINGVLRPGIVHRIDKDTSGLLIVAKSDKAHKSLALQIKEHSFLREYEAVVYGNVKTNSGVIDMPLARAFNDRKKMAVTDDLSRGKNAVTHYEVIAHYKDFTHIKCRLETGRTHQIRVHMTYIGHPVAGDMVYGPKKVIERLNGQCLHAKTIGFVHPITGENLYFDSQLPKYFTDFLASLK